MGEESPSKQLQKETAVGGAAPLGRIATLAGAGFGAPIIHGACEVVLSCEYDNDPSAGSPTETLLRLLLPRNVQI